MSRSHFKGIARSCVLDRLRWIACAVLIAASLAAVHLSGVEALASGPWLVTAPGSSAACGTQPDFCTPYFGEDIFSTYPPHAPSVIPGSYLGLVPGDVLNSVSVGFEAWFFYPDARVHFSVDIGAVGIPGAAPDVASEAAGGQAAADVFDGGTFGVPAPNVLLVDGDGLPAAAPPALGLAEPADNLSGLTSCTPFYLGNPMFFTLAPGSPTLATLGATAADILESSNGATVVVRSHADLGLDPADVIDAISLYWAIDDQILYSLSPGSPTLTALGLQPGDILRYSGTPTVTLAIAGTALGLAPGDNLDALDVVQDSDGDLASDLNFTCDNCVGVRTTDQTNSDQDASGDACDTCTDTDGDGRGNPGFAANTCPTDNCPTVYNPSQIDGDGDGSGDSCDLCPGADDNVAADADGDGVLDLCDMCPGLDDADPTAPCSKLFTLEGLLTLSLPARLRIVNPFSLRTLYTVDLTLPGRIITGGRGLAVRPDSGAVFALLELTGQTGYELVTVDPSTGVATSLGSTTDRFGGLTFDAQGTLYAVTDDTTVTLVPESLYTLDTSNAAPTLVLSLGNGDTGEAIAFRLADGRLYHASGESPPVFESVDPQTLTVTNIPLLGPASPVNALAEWRVQNVFLGVRLLGTAVERITPFGVITALEARFDHSVKGLAFAWECGNRRLGAGEQCDDGNAVGGDCCSATCGFEAAGSPCNGGTCDGTGGCALLPGPNKCVASKLKALAKRQSGKLGCHAKAVQKGDLSGVAACVSKAQLKFDRAFAKVASSCPGDQSGCAAIADDCVAMAAAALPDAGPSKCEATKLKAAGRKAKAKLGCYAKAAVKGTAVDDTPGGCLQKATLKFSTAFARAENAGFCTGDQGAVETLIDAECVSDVVQTDSSGMVQLICP